MLFCKTTVHVFDNASCIQFSGTHSRSIYLGLHVTTATKAILTCKLYILDSHPCFHFGCNQYMFHTVCCLVWWLLHGQLWCERVHDDPWHLTRTDTVEWGRLTVLFNVLYMTSSHHSNHCYAAILIGNIAGF